MNLPLKLIVLTLLIAPSLWFTTQASMWSEGQCDQFPADGATRLYFNGAAYIPWENMLGDWLDVDLSPQGDNPFAQLHGDTASNTSLTADVTSLVQHWLSKTIKNRGFFLKYANGSQRKIFTKESMSAPKLKLTYQNKEVVLTSNQDTELNQATYKCLGSKDNINLHNHGLIFFSLPETNKLLLKAELLVNTTKPFKQTPIIDVYAVRLPDYHYDLLTLSNTSKLLDEHVIYQTSFDSYDWRALWQIEHDVKLVKANLLKGIDLRNKYQPLDGNALRVTIAENTHVGVSAKLLLDQFDTLQAIKNNTLYMRYHLRFGDTWQTEVDGKLPGFSGTYASQSYRGGWGGRRSTGKNGWSARGRFSPTTPLSNPLSDRVPIGSYLYHSNMPSPYGDVYYWQKNDKFVLKKNNWYAIDQRITMNSSGKKNGVLQAWIDNILVFEKRDINFSDHPDIGIEAIWLNVYHGGKEKADKNITLYIDELTLSSQPIGSLNRDHKE